MRNLKLLNFIILLIFSVGLFTLSAQTPTKPSKTAGIEQGSFQWIVEPKYQSIGQFDEGLAPFGLNGKFGYLDRKGSVVIPPSYAGYLKFSEGVAGVEKIGDAKVALANDNKWGYINTGGSYAIKPQFDYAAPFSNGVAGVKVGDKYGFIDKSGNIVVEPQYKYVYNTFNEGLLALTTLNSKFGYIDVDGNMVIPAVYAGANTFSDGLGAVKEKYDWGFVDHGGELIIPMLYSQVGNFKNGICKVQQKTKWGYINKDGIEKVKIQYEEINNISEDAVGCKLGGKWGFVDLEGNTFITHRFDEAGNFSNGIAPIRQAGKWGYIDRTGDFVIPAVYESASDFLDGYAKIKKNGKWGYIDKNGNTILEPQFDEASEIKDLYARVKKAGKWGLILFKRMANTNYLLIKGKITNSKTNTSINGVTVLIEELATGKIIEKLTTNTNGEYKSQKLDLGKKYGIYATVKDYIAENQRYTNSDTLTTKSATIDLKMHPIELGEKVTLNNIFFEFGKAAILSSSYPDLDLLANILKEHPNMKIEIAGHTDNRGSKEKNLQVSKDRAKTLKSYLVKKGVPDTRIDIIGFGASVPIAPNDTEEGRTKNRRVEYKITSK